MELCLSIPFLGGLFIIGNLWAPLFFMFILHIFTLVISLMEKRSFYGSTFGILTSILGVIPFVGMMMHFISAMLLFLSALDQREYKK